MSNALQQGMTGAEFIAWEAGQEQRYEFDGFRPVAMTGGREAHEDIQANLIAALRTRLRGQPCRAYGPNMKILADASYRYPDALIVCGPRDPKRTIAEDPVVVFEIISESTQQTDRVRKNFEYRNTPSIQRYVILEQDVIGATVFTRSGDDWAGRVQGSGSVLLLPEAGITLPLDELYDGLDLPA
jgi:Uma2 family endonuclease